MGRPGRGTLFRADGRITIESFYARIHEEDRTLTRDAIDASIGNRTPYDIVYRTVHPTTGAGKWIRALGGTDYASDGTPTHFDGVTVDVSAQKNDQQALSSLNHQLRGNFRAQLKFPGTLSRPESNHLRRFARPPSLVSLRTWNRLNCSRPGRSLSGR